ncbi:MAG: hydroxyacylglutathione hydrolase [Pseudomonadota bacterium]|nr:hydroxyacylglutathione hydrolase [Pseudomonadota bacterium]
MQLHAIPIFSDNYVWVLIRGQDAVVVDPGDGAPVARYLQENALNLQAILVTHHHPDHIAGIPVLLGVWPVPVYGPADEAAQIKLLSHQLNDGDAIEVLGECLQVVSLPGHTLGHIAYVQLAPDTDEAPFVLCGDTLFSAGCGRLFEGTPAQMHASMQRLDALPANSRMYCTHEYTLSNLAFARAVEPDNRDIQDHICKVQTLRADGIPSVPTTLALERRINPFLRTREHAARQAAETWAGSALNDEVMVFAALRKWKDGFRAP